MATIVVSHGAWSSAWAWQKMRPLLRAAGHDIFTPSYTGLGERAHLATPDIDLETHIADILGVLQFEDLRDVVLIGHSYGGMVATGVADRADGRVARLIYLDAFAPKDGQSLFQLVGVETEAKMRQGAAESGDGWKVPSMPMPPDTPPDYAAWAAPRRLQQPIKCFEQTLTLSGRPLPRRSYIYCKRIPPHDIFGQFAARAKTEGWGYAEMDASHNPHITCPEDLRDVLQEIILDRKR
ncbi:alpha/beta hydrolase [Pseudorhodoplanes sp.]|uniref:alpha/beta fold hydrolase n=1 Tax=Pseudorhodoplanes sp. TaxID=1934341 RepID=UPI002BA9EAED|nr:alpha/beta hydrolase [Pseudorhodoplanes sp.]HWV53528.1 alpha/beta hydrolase [Pseudorhodoplanes sp.]